MNVNQERRRIRVPAERLVHGVVVETEAEAFRVRLHILLEEGPAQLRLRIERDPKNARVRIQLAWIWTEMAALYRRLADRRDSPVDSRDANLRSALDLYRRSLGIWQDLRSQGMLSRIDATKPDEVAREITNYDANL